MVYWNDYMINLQLNNLITVYESCYILHYFAHICPLDSIHHVLWSFSSILWTSSSTSTNHLNEQQQPTNTYLPLLHCSPLKTCTLTRLSQPLLLQNAGTNCFSLHLCFILLSSCSQQAGVLKTTRLNVKFVIDYSTLCFCVIKGASDVL